MRIEILYVPGCPGLAAARQQVRQWLKAPGRQATVEEILVTTAAQARRRRFSGSPTIRIDGCELDGGQAPGAGGVYCRLAPQEIPHGHA